MKVEKVRIAVRLRKETVATVAWPAERLQMGRVANVNTLPHPERQGQDKRLTVHKNRPLFKTQDSPSTGLIILTPGRV